jgi:polar amino acid transport system substrate-binding protein
MMLPQGSPGRLPGNVEAFMNRIFAAVVASFAWMAGPVVANEMVPTGTLRATFIATNPVQAVTDPSTGEVRGPAAELTRELASQLGIPFKITGVQGVAGVINSVKNGEADIGFVAYDPERAKEVDFSQTYSLAQNTYLVLDRSPIRSIDDVDRPGIRIGVGARDAGDLFLTRTLKYAQLDRNPGGNLDVALTKLKAGEIDAYAANRQRLSAFAARVAEVRLLPDNFYGVEQAIIVPKGNVGLAAVNRFLDDARASGLIAAAIERAGLVGVDVAPPREGR